MPSSHTSPSDTPDLQQGITRALQASFFAARALRLEASAADAEGQAAALTQLAAEPWTAERMAAEVPLSTDSEQTAVALRRLRRRVLLSLIARDAAGVAPLIEVMSTMTALAELAVQRLLAALGPELAQTHGVPCSDDGTPQDMLVIAMGKGGGNELNVSSDLDLIFVYDDGGETRAMAQPSPYADATRLLSNHEFFERLGRRLINALSDNTADGFVFRIDMRLRPHGDAGPLAVSNLMLEEYLITQGREWERFAWLKGRVISAPLFATPEQFAAQCKALDAVVRPFVYRKYLDFGAIAALRELHALIRAETQRKTARGAAGHRDHDNNVKLGRGGIREIEFIAQTFQVIRGGHDARLRGRSTLATLNVLAKLSELAPETAAELERAYDFLRRLEHALQYIDDAQTHLLPDSSSEQDKLERIATLLRTNTQELRAHYEQTREFVANAFDAVFLAPKLRAPDGTNAEEPAPALDLHSVESLIEQLQARGFAEPEQTARRVQSLLASRRVATASSATQRNLEQLLQHACESAQSIVARHAGAAELGTGIAPDEVVARLASLLEVIAGRSTYSALLAQYPAAFMRLLRLLAASRWATDYLVRHPILLDELLDERLIETVPSWSVWAADIEAQLLVTDDVEREMNLLRDAHHAQVFRLLLADLEGRLSVEHLADHLSALADETVALALALAWRHLPKKHRDVPQFAVIGYGKLGGKELGYASDLDLVFIYDDEHADAPEVYAALARRLVLWLTTQTSSGNLFDVDLRLRPDGDSGLTVTSRAAFEQYQRNDAAIGHGAWTWEHQALTRARFIAGDAALGAKFEALRNDVLARPRDREKLIADVIDMRRKMLAGHPNRSGLFDLKHDRGGMVDIEFVVQFLVLAYAHDHPRLLGNLGNIALLNIAAELGLLDAAIAAGGANAYRHYRKLQHALRLNGAGKSRLPSTEIALQVEDVLLLWREVFGTVEPC